MCSQLTKVINEYSANDCPAASAQPMMDALQYPLCRGPQVHWGGLGDIRTQCRPYCCMRQTYRRRKHTLTDYELMIYSAKHRSLCLPEHGLPLNGQLSMQSGSCICNTIYKGKGENVVV